MFTKIMVPVDLAHAAQLEKALGSALDLAKHYNASLYYVGVAASAPGAIAHNPEEYQEKLAAFAKQQVAGGGVQAFPVARVSHDPTTDLNDVLLSTIEELGADLVVMASHIPTLVDSLWPSHGGSVARKAKVSVLVVR